MQGNRRPINAPDGQRPQTGVPWIGLATVIILGLILAVAVAYLLFGVGRDGGAGSTNPTAGPARTGSVVPEGRVLGFPTVATRNTTRIPAADPVEVSLASLLASFPSVDLRTAPTAITVASSEEWPAAAAAAALSAGPVGAPLMLAPSGKLSPEGVDLLETLGPTGSPRTREAQVFTVGKVAPPTGYEVERIPGDSAAELGVAVASRIARLSGEPPEAVVIVSDAEAGYAAAAATWAARSGDPILFTDGESLSTATREFLERKANREVPAFVLGPPEAVSPKVVEQIRKVAASVERIPGRDPVEASLELVRYASGSFGWNLNDPGHGFTVIRSNRPMDGIAATPLSTGGTWPALLMTDRAEALPEDVLQYLLDVQPGYSTDPTRALYNHIWIIGDETLIDLEQQAQIDRAAELVPVGGAVGG